MEVGTTENSSAIQEYMEVGTTENSSAITNTWRLEQLRIHLQ